MPVPKGFKHSLASRLKMSASRKGKQMGSLNPMFGYKFSKKQIERKRLSHLGKRHTEEAKRKISLSNKGVNTWTKGRHLSLEHRRKIGDARLRCSPRVFSALAREHMREARIKYPNKHTKDTGIERKMEKELLLRSIPFKKQVPLFKIAVVDFYLPEHQVVIQCDGDYWHNKPGAQEKDARQNKVLKENGMIVYRFWEREINQSTKECLDRVKEIQCG